MQCVCLCGSAGHGLHPGGASPAGDPRPPAAVLRQPGRAGDAGAQELRHEEGWPGQVRGRRWRTTKLLGASPRLSRGELPAGSPLTAPLPLRVRARRDPTSGSLQNTRGRLVIIPPRATSISAHCIFHWVFPSPSSLCFALHLSVSPPLSVRTVFTTSSAAKWKRWVCVLH